MIEPEVLGRLAETLYTEAAARHIIRHDSVLWPLATIAVREKWRSFAAFVCRQTETLK